MEGKGRGVGKKMSGLNIYINGIKKGLVWAELGLM